jgi:hypothetical protein
VEIVASKEDGGIIQPRQVDVSKSNYQILHDFVIRQYQNEDEENPSYHGFCKELSQALVASFWQTKSFGST